MSAPASTAPTPTASHGFAPLTVERAESRAIVVSALLLILVLGFGFRAYRLGAESLSEDELNKVRAVAEYRERGLTPANGEHPFLMKALLTVSISAADAWNATSFVVERPKLAIPEETSARLPGALLGALTAILIFLVATELFGLEVGLVAAALWAFDPAAIGFNRIAKEDSFLVFFFLLANVFWLRGQRVAEESGAKRPEPYYWAAAAAFGAMLASKYVPHFFAISAAYYYVFQGVKSTRWRLGKRKWLIFFAVMGAAFLVCNPTILLPGTWHEMRIFAGEKRIGHDGYEFWGDIYRNQMTLWLNGSPWYFYYVFIGFKLPSLVIGGFLVGLLELFRRRLGYGRWFLVFWLFFWFFPFTFLGGKFTRYFTFALPVVILTAAIGLSVAAQFIAGHLSRLNFTESFAFYARSALLLAAISLSAYASASAAPHYRLYTNWLGGGTNSAGNYFPHDEFYDSSIRETVEAVSRLARPGARVASETPELLYYYSQKAGREDIRSVSLSNPHALASFEAGDLVVIARGRRYFSNDAIIQMLRETVRPGAVVNLGDVESARVYSLDARTALSIRELSRR